MALLKIEGFDGLATANGQSLTSRLLQAGWATVTGALSNTDTRIGRGYSMALDMSSTGGGLRYAYFYTPNQTQVFVGFAVRFFNGSGPLWSVQYDNLTGDVYQQFTVYKNGIGGISILDYQNNLLGYSDNDVIRGSTWNFVELSFTGTHIVVKVNGDIVIDADMVLRHPNAPAIYNRMGMTVNYFDHWEGQTSPRWDDLYVANDQGSALDQLLGDIVVEDLLLTSDASPNEMDLVGAASHWQALNERPPDDDTSYLRAEVADESEMFTLATLPSDFIDVLAVEVVTRATKEGTGYKCFRNRVTLDAVTEESDDLFTSAGYGDFGTIFSEKPGGGSWAPADFTNLLVGFRSTVTP